MLLFVYCFMCMRCIPPLVCAAAVASAAAEDGDLDQREDKRVGGEDDGFSIGCCDGQSGDALKAAAADAAMVYFSSCQPRS